MTDDGTLHLRPLPALRLAQDPWLAVDAVLAERGLESWGLYRQLHLEDTDDDRQVFELQRPVRESGGACPLSPFRQE